MKSTATKSTGAPEDDNDDDKESEELSSKSIVGPSSKTAMRQETVSKSVPSKQFTDTSTVHDFKKAQSILTRYTLTSAAAAWLQAIRFAMNLVFLNGKSGAKLIRV